MLFLTGIFLLSLLVFALIVGWWGSKLGVKRYELYREHLIAKTTDDLDFLFAEIHAENIVRYTLFSTVGLGALVFFISSFNPFFAIIAAIAGSFIPRIVIKRMRNKKLSQFDSQLPDIFSLIVSAMRAGNTLVQALQYSTQEIGQPYRNEMIRTMREYQLGVPIQDALDKMAKRIGSQEFALTVAAIKISMKTGSNLTEIIENITDTVISRNKLLDKIKTITQEARMQANILLAFPLFMIAGFYLIDPELVIPLFKTTLGLLLIGVVILLEAVGYVVMKYLSKIEA